MKKQVLFLLLVAFCFGGNAQTILGLDVSHYDSDPPIGPENWSQVKAAGKRFAWAKATEGITYTDSTFVRNEVDGQNAGVVMGAYHFATPESNTATAEANHFLSVAGPYIRAGYLPPVLDLEDPPGGPALSAAFTSAQLTTWVQTWMTTVQSATGIAPIIYTDGNYAGYLNSSLNIYKLWIADPDGSATAQPATTGVWTTWTFKQYSWTGTVSGINDPSNVDLDVFNGDTTAFNILIGNTVIPNFISNVQSICPGMQVAYTDHSTSTGTITGYRWIFSGGSPDTSTARNPIITYNISGTYTVKEVVISSSGTDSLTKTAYINVRPTSTLPLSETFQSSTFPPTGWSMNFPNPADSAWELCTTAGYSSTQCMYFPANCGYTNNITGQRQQIYTPDYNFIGVSSPKMWFDVAYEPFNRRFSDTLAIYYSLDCGSTWTNIYLKGGMTLCTTGSTDSLGTDTSGGRGCFVPPNVQAWRKDSISLASLSGDGNVLFSFESRSGWGNIIYIDNINIAASCTPPAVPMAVSPGTASGPGSSVSSVTLVWDTAVGAVTYYPRISQCPYGTPNIIWQDTCHAGTSESATLPAGNIYRWNIGAYSQCGNPNCESDGNTLYFNIPPILTNTGNTTFCQGDSMALHTTAGNTVSTAEFHWYLNGTLVDSTTTGIFYAKQTGSYTAAISYSCGITGVSNSIAVHVITPPVSPSITSVPGLVACGPIQLTASSSGCTGCVYSWSTTVTDSVVTVTTTGTYHVTATGNGCASSPASVAVTINQPPTVSASALPTQACVNRSIVLTATGNATSYQWSGTGLQTTTGSSVDAIVFTAGTKTYTVTATLNGCTAAASTTVSFIASVPPTISISQTTVNPICTGSTVSFSSSETNGGTSPVYQWSASSGQNGSGANFTLNNASSGTTVRCLLISNATCASPDSLYSNTLTVTTLAPQPESISISTPDTNVCSGENIVFTSSSTNGGNNPTYDWYVNGTSTGTSSTYTLSNIQSNSAVYCIMTSSVSCVSGSPASSNIVDIHIQVSAVASVSISASADTICAGTPVTFTANPGNGGSSPAYSWLLNGNTVGSNVSTYTNSHLQNGDRISCSMISSASCVSSPNVGSDTITMLVNPLPTADAGTDVHILSGSSDTIGGNPSASGGTPPYRYLWSPIVGLDYDTVPGPIVSGISTNTIYILSVTDARGCSASDTMGVYLISCTLSTPTLQLNQCDLDAQNIPTVSYQWYLQGNPIGGANTRFYTVSQSGYYFVKVNDSLGCSAQSQDTFVSYPSCLVNGVEAILNQPAFEIYPNPAFNEITISYANTLAENANIEISDLIGQTVYHSTISTLLGYNWIINIATLPAGTYLMKITNGKGVSGVRRFIKM